MLFFTALPHQIDQSLQQKETEASIDKAKDQEDAEENTDVTRHRLNDIVKSFDLLSISLNNVSSSFINILPSITDEEVNVINKLTINQHQNANWHRLRKGRITASKFYQVFTRINTICKKGKENTDCSSLIKTIMCYEKVNPNIKALKYGRETESIAVNDFINSYKKKHSDVKSECCGMFIDKENVFLSASPDLLISCSCCGDGLLEVKCPLIPECQLCESFCVCKLPDFIFYVNEELSVKQNHAYYVQIQGQLAITKRSWCDLYVYTVNGPFQQRITLDSEFYLNRLLPNLNLFFTDYIVPELLHGDVFKQLQCNQTKSESVTVNAIDSSQSRYFCPVCNCFIKEGQEISSYNDRSILCEKCQLWFHFQCVKVTKGNLKTVDKWYCPGCTV